MARRSISTLLITLTVAMMVGMREATGLAPPPPTLGNEEIVWLSPEREGDPGLFIVFENPEPEVVEPAAHGSAAPRDGVFRRLMMRFRLLR